MPRLGFYLFRQLLTAFLFTAVAITFVILFTQSFRLLALVIDNSSTLWIFIQLMLLSVPTFLPLILPLSLGLATIFVYNRLAVDSELVVMRAAGISPFRQALPALIFGGMIVVLCYIFTLWLSPAAHRNFVAMQHQVKDSFAVFLSRPGSFNDITDGLTFYTRKRGSGGALEGILIHDVRKPDTPVTIMADTGQVVDNNGQPEIIAFDGRRQEMDVATGRLSELSFDQYVLDLDALRSAAKRRLLDPREQSIHELLNPSPEMLRSRTTREHLLAELNQRFASPLLALCYLSIGLAAVLSGEFNRRGMSKRIILATLFITVIQATFMSLNNAVVKHTNLAYTLHLLAIAPMIASFLLFNTNILRRLRPVSKLSPS